MTTEKGLVGGHAVVHVVSAHPEGLNFSAFLIRHPAKPCAGDLKHKGPDIWVHEAIGA